MNQEQKITALYFVLTVGPMAALVVVNFLCGVMVLMWDLMKERKSRKDPNIYFLKQKQK